MLILIKESRMITTGEMIVTKATGIHHPMTIATEITMTIPIKEITAIMKNLKIIFTLINPVTHSGMESTGTLLSSRFRFM